MKVCVAGATGGTGRWVVAELVQRQIPVKALVRDPAKAQNLLPEFSSALVELVPGNLLDRYCLEETIGDATAIINAAGARPSLNPFGPLQVDYWGTRNLIDVAKAKKMQQFVLVSSLLTSVFWHPLNLLWLVLFWKKQAETYIQTQNGAIPYTIVRPGGLLTKDTQAAICMQGADQFLTGRISRRKVAQVCVEALFVPAAQNKIVEIIMEPDAPVKPIAQLFAEVDRG